MVEGGNAVRSHDEQQARRSFRRRHGPSRSTAASGPRSRQPRQPLEDRPEPRHVPLRRADLAPSRASSSLAPRAAASARSVSRSGRPVCRWSSLPPGPGRMRLPPWTSPASTSSSRMLEVGRSAAGLRCGPHPGLVHHQPRHQPGGQVRPVVGGDGRVPAARYAPRWSVRCPVRAIAAVPSRTGVTSPRTIRAMPQIRSERIGFSCAASRTSLLAGPERLGQLADLGPLSA